jgi:hypothetical protein
MRAKAVISPAQETSRRQHNEERPPVQFKRQQTKLIQQDSYPAKNKNQTDPKAGGLFSVSWFDLPVLPSQSPIVSAYL